MRHYPTEAGATVTIVDRDPEGDKASMGTAGAVAAGSVSNWLVQLICTSLELGILEDLGLAFLCIGCIRPN